MQLENPESKKVAEVASAAGEKWRSLSEEEKKGFEEASEKAKVGLQAQLHLHQIFEPSAMFICCQAQLCKPKLLKA